MQKDLSIAIIVPAHNAAQYLKLTLPIYNKLKSDCQIIFVNDASTDDSAALLRDSEISVIENDRQLGVSASRNRGAKLANADLLLFVDADVLISEQVVVEVRKYFTDRLDLCAAFGSYDAFPAVQALVSQFRNLLHHYIHQQNNGPAISLWGGFLAIRRDDFFLAGLFNEQISYLEDIELGIRLNNLNKKMELRAEWQVKHLKAWSFFQMLHSDIFCRVKPWVMLEKNAPLSVLNNSKLEKLRAVFAILLLNAFIAVLFLKQFGYLFFLFLLLAVILNYRFYLLLYRVRGAFFALAGFLLHQFYYIYCVVSYLFFRLSSRSR